MYERFEELCKEMGVTPYKVAKATGVSTATISNWKAGRYTPKAGKLLAIAKYFGVDYSYLMGYTNERTHPKNVIDMNATCDIITESFWDAVDRGEIVLPEEESNPKLEQWIALFHELTEDQIDEAMEFIRLFVGACPEARSSLVSLLKTLKS